MQEGRTRRDVCTRNVRVALSDFGDPDSKSEPQFGPTQPQPHPADGVDS